MADASSLPAAPAVYVDIAGDSAVRSAVHGHFGDELRHSAVVGATHWEAPGDESGEALPGPQPEFFFAPDHVRRRSADCSAVGQAELVRTKLAYAHTG